MIETAITIFAFLAVLVVLVIAHELGHFITAKARKVPVIEFGLGFPPRLFGVKRGETIYSLNLVPLGGFVKLAGEENPDAPGGLSSKGIGTRLLVLSAGSLVNLLLPVLLFSIAFMIPHNLATGDVAVENVLPDSPAARAGMEPGDIIVSLNGKPVNNIGDVQRYIQLNLGKEITMQIKHSDGTIEQVQLVPRWRPPEGQGAVGIKLAMPAPTIIRESLPFWRAIPAGVVECIQTYVLFKNGIISMIIGTTPVAVTGPVGIAQLTGEVAKSGIAALLEFAAFLSINLGIINIFPLPALDGGRIAFVLLEVVRRGKRISPRLEALVHSIGFALLITLLLVITYQDILRIMSGENLIP